MSQDIDGHPSGCLFPELRRSILPFRARSATISYAVWTSSLSGSRVLGAFALPDPSLGVVLPFDVGSPVDGFVGSLVVDASSIDADSAAMAGISTSPVVTPVFVGSASVTAEALAFDFDLEGDEERERAAGGGIELSGT